MGLVVHVTISPGLEPLDRGYVEDLLVDALDEQLNIDADSIGGGTMLGDDGPAESDFDLELDRGDPVAIAALIKAVLSEIGFSLRTTMTVTIGEAEPFVVVAGGT